MIDDAIELNLEGLVGPTFQLSGLASGDLASQTNRGLKSSPKEAALQGLSKAWHLAAIGIPEAILPPQERPDMTTLRQLGFNGSDRNVIDSARREAPRLLASCYSASSMWTANAATTTPSVDAIDKAVHFTCANQSANLHRALETRATGRVLKAIFPTAAGFRHHRALPPSMGDEGAANHTRLCHRHGEKGLHLFVFGRSGLLDNGCSRSRFVPRQTLEASAAVARLHQLPTSQVMFAQQNSRAVDAGVFHNDVIATGNQELILYHEFAFSEPDRTLSQLRDQYYKLTSRDLHVELISQKELPLDAAVRTYLFNSQLLTLPGGSVIMLAPGQCADDKQANAVIKRLLDDPGCPVKTVEFSDVNHSMQNGGGPACLRLRVVLTRDELARMTREVCLTKDLYDKLVTWIVKHYRDELSEADLGDPALPNESRLALDELTQILQIGPIYSFQR